jgi:hypothetical protein
MIDPKLGNCLNWEYPDILGIPRLACPGPGNSSEIQPIKQQVGENTEQHQQSCQYYQRPFENR